MSKERTLMDPIPKLLFRKQVIEIPSLPVVSIEKAETSENEGNQSVEVAKQVERIEKQKELSTYEMAKADCENKKECAGLAKIVKGCEEDKKCSEAMEKLVIESTEAIKIATTDAEKRKVGEMIIAKTDKALNDYVESSDSVYPTLLIGIFLLLMFVMYNSTAVEN